MSIRIQDVPSRRESERRFRLIADDVKDYGIVMLEPAGHVVRWNPGAERTFGYRAEEILDQHVARFYAADAIAQDVPAEELRRAETTGRFETEGWRVRKGGARFWASVVLNAVRDESGVMRAFLLVTRDLHERRRVQDDQRFLAEASGVLAETLDVEATLAKVARLTVPVLADWCVVDLADESGRIRRVEVAQADPAKEELAARLCRVPTGSSTEGPRAQALRAGRPVLVGEIDEATLARLAQDGPELSLLRDVGAHSLMVVPLSARNRTVGALALIAAESGRQYGPDDLWLAEELGRRVALAVDNASLYANARGAIRARDEFLSVAAHELRTPLTALQLRLQSLHRTAEESVENPGNGAVREEEGAFADRLEGAIRDTRRLARLIDTLLDVSRISAGRLRLELCEFNLEDVAREVVARFRPQAVAVGSDLSLRMEGGSFGCWDRFRVEQVLTNLLANAIKYGMGKPIEVTVSGDGDVARLAVRDHGIGIAPENRDRIFHRFERAVPAHHYGGLGLGLYIARQIVEAHGGRISAWSEPGAGAIFAVELPQRLPGLAKRPEGNEGPEGPEGQVERGPWDDATDRISTRSDR